MKPLSRRSVTTGLAAAVMALPAVGLCASASENNYERIGRLTRELEQAMREAYQSDDVRVLSYGPHDPVDPGEGVSPGVLIVAH